MLHQAIMSRSDPHNASQATLDAMQALFAQALNGFKDATTLLTLAQQGIEQQVWAGDAALVQQRLALYRGNGQAVTLAALRLQFPVVAQWVGDDFFEGLVRHYRHSHASQSGDLAERGKDFATFLKQFGPVQQDPRLACLPDLAHLEWAIHTAENAADTQVLSLAEFLSQHAHDLADQMLRLAAGTQLIESSYSIHGLWRVHQSDELSAGSLDWSIPEQLVIFRPQLRVVNTLLSPAEFAFIAACQSGQPIGTALELALDAAQVSNEANAEEFNFQASLLRLFEIGLFA